MGKFDGYLICSDVDGTFHMGDSIPGNSEAIEYFTRNGGSFTFCTGRTVDYLLRPDLNRLINAPACLFNGSVIYDYRENRLLFQKQLCFSLGCLWEVLAPVRELIRQVYIYQNYKDEGIILDNPGELPPEVAQLRGLKILFTTDAPEHTRLLRDFALGLPLADCCYISMTWGLGLEFNPAEGTKGHSLTFIKNHLGNIHTAIGVGDYENDIPLLTHGDIGAAVENALPQVKAAASILLPHAAQCAFPALIDLIESGKLLRR